MVVGGGAWLVTRPSVLGWIVAWRLSGIVGGEVTIGALHSLGDGRMRIDDLTLRAPGWPGMAGELASIQRITAQIDTRALWRGKIILHEFEINGGVLRIAERSSGPTRFNLFSLDPAPSDTEDGRSLPSIQVLQTRVEIGDLLPDGAFRLRGSTQLTGELRLAPGSSTEYLIRLSEAQTDGVNQMPGGMQISGSIDRRTLSTSLELGRLRFDDRLVELMPQAVREWWDRLDFSGEILSASLQLGESRPPEARLTLGPSELTIPLNTGLNWMIVRRGRMEPAQTSPRISVRGGTIRLVGTTMSFEKIEGLVTGSAGPWPSASVPLRIDLTIPDLPAFIWEERSRWLDDTLASAGFSGRIQLLDFAMGLVRTDETIELPYAIADILDAFRLSRWRLSAELQIRRDGPIFDATGQPVGQPLRYKGKAALADASLEYEKFPFPLRGVQGILSFDEDAIVIESLRGRGRGGGEIVVTGRIAPPGPMAGFDVNIAGAAVPISERLRRALPPEARQVLDALLHRPAIAGLTESGLLVDEETLRRQRGAAAEAMSALTPDGPEARAAAGRIAALDRRLDVGPVTPGGTLSFDVDVRRPIGGQRMPMSLTGSVDLAGTTGAFQLFPYPFRITKGSIFLTPDAVDLGPGVELVTAGGGVGRVEGRVEFPELPDGSRAFRPDLRITVVEDRVNPMLLAAIPPSQPDMEAIEEAGIRWPGEGRSDAAELLEAIALQGEVGGRAKITTAEDGKVAWDVVVSLQHGSAMPTEQLETLLSGTRLEWPREMALSDISATLRVDKERLRIDSVKALAGDAPLEARGEVDVRVEPPTVLAQATVRDVTVGPWMISLAPPEDRPRLRQLWTRLDPSGVLDVNLDVSAGGGGTQTAFAISPRQIEATMSGQRVGVDRRSGELSMTGHGLRLEGLELDLRADGHDQGTVRLDGILPDGQSPGQVEGSWERARFECPVIEEGLRLAGLDEALKLAETLRPSGSFEATFAVNLSPDWSVLHHAATVTPDDLGLLLGGERLTLRFAEGLVQSTEASVRLEHLRGRHDDGTFAIDGQVALEHPRTGHFDLAVESSTFSSPFRAMLPEALRSSLEAIELELGGGFDAEASLALRSTDAGWWSSWRGPIVVRQGTIRPGVEMTDIDGRLEVQASGGGSEPTELRIDLLLDRLLAAGRLVRTVSGILELGPAHDSAPQRLLLRSIHGDLYGGVVELFGSVEAAPGGEYDIGVAIAGAGLAGLEGISDPAEETSSREQEGVEGRLRALVTLAGRAGDDSSRRGRGQVYLDDARIADMPIMMALLQLTQLMLPLRGSLSEGVFEFHLLGDEVTFDRLLLASETVEMVGRGTLDVRDMRLAVRFEPRGRLPLLSELMSPISGNLWAIEVTGPLAAPRASLVPLPSLQAILVQLPGVESSSTAVPQGPRALRPTRRTSSASPDTSAGAATPPKPLPPNSGATP